jgi:hypothetical protein
LCSCSLGFSSCCLRSSFLVIKDFKVHTWLSWVLRSSEDVWACYSCSLTAPRWSWCFGGSLVSSWRLWEPQESLVYTVRDPPFRRWRTGTLSEHLSLGDLRGSNTLIRGLGGSVNFSIPREKIRSSLVPLSLLYCIHFHHLISALKFPCLCSL